MDKIIFIQSIIFFFLYFDCMNCLNFKDESSTKVYTSRLQTLQNGTAVISSNTTVNWNYSITPSNSKRRRRKLMTFSERFAKLMAGVRRPKKSLVPILAGILGGCAILLVIASIVMFIKRGKDLEPSPSDENYTKDELTESQSSDSNETV